MFTKLKNGEAVILALAPLSVLPQYQRQGVGTALVNEGHKIAKDLGYSYSVVLGSEKYYPRFGYEPAKKFRHSSSLRCSKGKLHGIEAFWKCPGDFRCCSICSGIRHIVTNIKHTEKPPLAANGSVA